MRRAWAPIRPRPTVVPPPRRHRAPHAPVQPRLGPVCGEALDAGRDAILSEFIGVIREHVLLGVAVGMDTKFYRTMPPEVRKRWTHSSSCSGGYCALSRGGARTRGRASARG